MHTGKKPNSDWNRAQLPRYRPDYSNGADILRHSLEVEDLKRMLIYNAHNI